MKIIDEKGKLFKIINVVDLLVIIAIVLIGAGVIYKLSNTVSDTAGPKEKYVATVLCKEVFESAAINLKENDKIVYGNAYANGYISKVDYEPAKIETINSNGEITFTEHPNLMDVYVDIIIEVTPNSDFIMLGKYQVNIGKSLVVKTHRVEIDGIVQNIKEHK